MRRTAFQTSAHSKKLLRTAFSVCDARGTPGRLRQSTCGAGPKPMAHGTAFEILQLTYAALPGILADMLALT